MVAWCIKNGIPFDVAHALPMDELLSYTVLFSSFENGKQFDWNKRKFIPQ
jgi:hypothetical protein